MASKSIIFAIIVAVNAIIAAPALATDYWVGDSAGWTLGVNYTAWAEGKDFFVGDTLVFKYQVGTHNVFKVNGTAFQQCSKPPPSEGLISGNDVITLGTPGRKWYICGVGSHCDNGMKLVITVWPVASSPTPAPAPAPAPAYGAQMKKPLSIWKLLKSHS